MGSHLTDEGLDTLLGNTSDPLSVATALLRALRKLRDPVIVISTDWRYLYVNDQAALHLKRPRSQIIGELIWDYFPLLPGSTFDVTFREAMASQTSRQIIQHHPPADRWYRVGIHPTPEALVLHIRDISDEHHAELLNDRLLKSLEGRLEHQKRHAL